MRAPGAEGARGRDAGQSWLVRAETLLLLAPGTLLLVGVALLVDAATRGAFLRTELTPAPVAASLSALALASLLLRRHVVWKARLVLALLAAGGAWFAPWAHREHVAQLRGVAEGPARAALLGRPAPRLDWMFAMNMTPEREARLREPRQRLLLVDFWATWCAPCIEHMPRLQVLHALQEADALSIVGVTTFYGGDLSPQGVDAELARIRAFLEEHGIEYPIVVTADTALHERFHVESLPTSVLVGRDGSVLDIGIGVVGTREVFEHARQLVE